MAIMCSAYLGWMPSVPHQWLGRRCEYLQDKNTAVTGQSALTPSQYNSHYNWHVVHIPSPFHGVAHPSDNLAGHAMHLELLSKCAAVILFLANCKVHIKKQ